MNAAFLVPYSWSHAVLASNFGFACWGTERESRILSLIRGAKLLSKDAIALTMQFYVPMMVLCVRVLAC